MTRYFAFLRAINVGGHIVKMDQLRRIFESLGFSSIETCMDMDVRSTGCAARGKVNRPSQMQFSTRLSVCRLLSVGQPRSKRCS